ncbi:MAG: Hsp20/alpha crystallin family protein [Bacteriovoracaceae bacterium]|jgi:HSP20 family molecular chaperone IbpA|nr:Hsp20/alpha crystallin family protein [Deltaproteobacteria bacterium]MDI9542736.1 Hsp20/alpha crystallin family protein [Pseudomonadota bacterium]NLW69286.1 Hsp20/alpha crystallin family protein [Bacteriovoracaceae bacterium]HRR20970.1 Hsp20/alpha crystallin family protein [Desulfomonilia bacterium]HNR51554.1 Hsp20/alpha crystallin family protein [Deltaproteobacteria bacterium]
MAEVEKSREAKKQETPGNIITERIRTGRIYMPDVDISEDRDNLVLYADLPGAGDEDVSVTLENDVLTIEAKILPEKSDAHRLSHAEYGTGDYFRSFTINEPIDREKIEAKMKDGVLRIVLPKKEEAKPKQIKIHAG